MCFIFFGSSRLNAKRLLLTGPHHRCLCTIRTHACITHNGADNEYINDASEQTRTKGAVGDHSPRSSQPHTTTSHNQPTSQPTRPTNQPTERIVSVGGWSVGSLAVRMGVYGCVWGACGAFAIIATAGPDSRGQRVGVGLVDPDLPSHSRRPCPVG